MPDKSPLEMVREFHEAFGHPIAKEPAVDGVSDSLRDLRIELIREEFEEFCSAAFGREVWVMVEPTPLRTYGKHDIVGVADALADMVYVIAGAALVYGVPLDDVFDAVHRANMAKLGPDGKPIYREDGKVIKPDGWQAPDVASILGVTSGD